jgi:glutathione S-transferase
MIVVHHLNQSRSQRVLWLLEELQLPYEIAYYERDNRNMAPEALRQIHPLGKSPIVRDGGRVVAESGAIIDYIVRRHGGGRLKPPESDALYEDYVYWLHYAEGSAVTPFIIMPIAESFGKMAAPLRRRVDWEMALNLRFSAISQSTRLRSGAAILPKLSAMGDDLTAADIQMSFVGELAAASANISEYPNIDRWVRRFQQREAYKAAVERGGHYKFQRKA